MRKIFDFHVHVYPDKIAEKVFRDLRTDEMGAICSNGTLKDTRRWMKEWNVDGFVMLNLATIPSQTAAANDFLYRSRSENVYPFGTLHPETPNLKDEIDRICSLGFKGIKFHPEAQDFEINDREKMYPVYETCLNKGLIIMFHCGIDPGYPGSNKADFRKAADLISDFPGSKIVLAHLSNYKFDPDLYNYIVGRDVWLDTSYAAIEHPADELKNILLSHPSDRLLYATDQPWTNGAVSQQKILDLDLPDELLDKIFYKNAEAILDMKL